MRWTNGRYFPRDGRRRLLLCGVMCAVTAVLASCNRDPQSTVSTTWAEQLSREETRKFRSIMDSHPGVIVQPVPLESRATKSRAGINVSVAQSVDLDEKAVDAIREVQRTRPISMLRLKSEYVQDGDFGFLLELNDLEFLEASSSSFGNEELNYVAELSGLRVFEAWKSRITDDGLKKLADTESLQAVTLANSRVTGSGFAAFANHANLLHVDVSGTKFDDEGLRNLAKIPNLTSIIAVGTKVTDAGLAELAKLSNLTYLNVESTDVTAEGAQRLQNALPKLRLYR